MRTTQSNTHKTRSQRRNRLQAVGSLGAAAVLSTAAVWLISVQESEDLGVRSTADSSVDVSTDADRVDTEGGDTVERADAEQAQEDEQARGQLGDQPQEDAQAQEDEQAGGQSGEPAEKVAAEPRSEDAVVPVGPAADPAEADQVQALERDEAPDSLEPEEAAAVLDAAEVLERESEANAAEIEAVIEDYTAEDEDVAVPDDNVQVEPVFTDEDAMEQLSEAASTHDTQLAERLDDALVEAKP